MQALGNIFKTAKRQIHGEADSESSIPKFGSLLESNKVLDLSYQRNLDAKCAKALAFALTYDEFCSELNMSGTSLGPSNASELARALLKNKTLRTLNLMGNNLGDDGARDFAKVLEKNDTITDLGLRYNKIGPAGTVQLAEALRDNRQVTALDLRQNAIGRDGVLALAGTLQAHPTLLALDMSYNSLGADAGLLAGVFGSGAGGLTSLNISRNGIGASTFCLLFEALLASPNKTLQSLHMAFNEMGSEGAQSLEGLLKTNACLTDLDVRANKINKQSCIDLMDSLTANDTVQSIDLRDNEIDDDVVEAMCVAVEHNTQIRNVPVDPREIDEMLADRLRDNLDGNSNLVVALGELQTDTDTTKVPLVLETLEATETGMKQRSVLDFSNRSPSPIHSRSPSPFRPQTMLQIGLTALAPVDSYTTPYRYLPNTVSGLALKGNFLGKPGALQVAAVVVSHGGSLTSLDLSQTQLGPAGSKIISEILRTDESITHLDIGHNRIGGCTNAAKALGSLLQNLSQNTVLTSLSVPGNCLGNDGLLYVARLLLCNSTLTAVDARRNKITDLGARHIAAALMSNHAVVSLNLSVNSIGFDGADWLSQALRPTAGRCQLDGVFLSKYHSYCPWPRANPRPNHTLTDLDLSGNNLEKEAKELLREMVSCAPVWTFLQMETHKENLTGYEKWQIQGNEQLQLRKRGMAPFLALAADPAVREL